MPPPPPLLSKSTVAAVDIPSFAIAQLALLDAELKAELAENSTLVNQTSPAALQRAGAALINLELSSQRTGLGGKTVIELELDMALRSNSSNGDLPEHGIRTGDIVAVQEQPAGAAKKREKSEMAGRGAGGVVLRVQSRSVSVALDKEDAEVPNGRLWIVKLANDVTYKRMNWTMTKLQKMADSECTPFIRVLFGQSSPASVPKNFSEVGLDKLEWVDPSLNDSQKDAVRFALASHDVALIHGPPGTGKTHTLIELILQMLKQKLRILVCGPSNISVDNIVERLAPHKIPMVRLGHPARLLPSVLNHSLDLLTQTSEAGAIVKDVRKEMDQKQASIRKTRNGRERRVIYGELKDLRKEYRDREQKCVSNLVKDSKVILTTLHGAGGFHLRNHQFDVVIIDEASQALEAQCWVPLLSAKKVVLAGDHLQLPPTIKSLNMKDSHKKAVGHGMTLETTLFDRLLKLYGPSIKRMLNIQYRMHEKIMTFPSEELYESKLKAGEDVKHRLLRDLKGVEDTDDTREPLVFWDTQGGDFLESTEDEDIGKKAGVGMSLGESKSNGGEAVIVKTHIRNLVAAGVKPEDMAVISPYNAQVALLSGMLKETYPGIELGSVDGFQGREKEAVVVSLVRSGGEIGFLAEKRRLNVSMTRPKRHLCVVGDSSTLAKGSNFLQKWMAFLEEHADLRYPDLVGIDLE